VTAVELAQDLPVLVSGVFAALCLTSAPIFRSRHAILLAQLGAGIGFATHYALLGITVASAANMLGVMQTLAAIFAARSASMNRLGYLLIVLMAAVGIWFWQGPISALSVMALILIALARMQTNEVHLRFLLIAGGCFWTAHDLIGAAWIPLAADIATLATGAAALAAMLFRVTIEWRPRLPAHLPAAA
jgi:hypothetical protein